MKKSSVLHVVVFTTYILGKDFERQRGHIHVAQQDILPQYQYSFKFNRDYGSMTFSNIGYK